MSHISGKLGNVYANALVLEDCEDVWVQGTADTTVSNVAGKVGVNCVRGTTVTVGATTLLMTEDFAPVDITTYDGIYFWIRSSVLTAADDLNFLLDETAACGSADETFAIPICAAAVWRQCFFRMVAPSALNALVSVGLYQKANLADGTFDIDDVEALKDVAGIKSWSLDYTADLLESTDFADVGAKSYIVGSTTWQGSFEGYKDGVPLSIGSEVTLVLGESTTAGNNWMGKAVITGCHPAATFDGIVTYSYDFFGTNILTPPDA
jgi:hypothetical protein